MLETIFASKAAERVLLYLENYGQGYARAIATTYGIPLNTVQKQLRKFEDGGVLVSRLTGRTRVYTWNPRYPFTKPLRALLAEAFKYIPDKDIKAYYRQRQRPRRAGKTL